MQCTIADADDDLIRVCGEKQTERMKMMCRVVLVEEEEEQEEDEGEEGEIVVTMEVVVAECMVRAYVMHCYPLLSSSFPIRQQPVCSSIAGQRMKRNEADAEA